MFQATSGSTEALTDDLVVGEAHDVHGVQRLLEVVLVLLAGDGNVTVGQEAVVVEAFEEQVRWRWRGKTS